MEKVRYMISDAANLVHVEAHVLRYWEDELELAVPRNELGHRYYTRENIQQFQKIKELKEQGYQLKAIRTILHSGENGVEQISEPTSMFLLEPDKWNSGGTSSVDSLDARQGGASPADILNARQGGVSPTDSSNARQGGVSPTDSSNARQGGISPESTDRLTGIGLNRNQANEAMEKEADRPYATDSQGLDMPINEMNRQYDAASNQGYNIPVNGVNRPYSVTSVQKPNTSANVMAGSYADSDQSAFMSTNGMDRRYAALNGQGAYAPQGGMDRHAVYNGQGSYAPQGGMDRRAVLNGQGAYVPQEGMDSRHVASARSSEERMEQFRELMSDIVGRAVTRNNEELSQQIGKEVGEQVIKELNYLSREQDEAAQERFRQLDAAIRGKVRSRKGIFFRQSNKAEVRRDRKEQQKEVRRMKKQEKKEKKQKSKQLKPA